MGNYAGVKSDILAKINKSLKAMFDYYFVSKYLENCNLQRWMRGNGKLSNYFLIISDKLVENIY